MKLELAAPAKVNLYLRVFERRSDGYHRIETAMLKLALADRVSVEVGSGDELSVRVPGHPELENSENLAVRAAQSYLQEANLKRRISIEIEKKVPIGGGLGGGSSDAAAVLRALEQMIGGVDRSRLRVVAATLGADIPFFLSGSPLALAKGIGEDLSAWGAPPARAIVLANPGLPVSTKKAYEALGRPLTYHSTDGNSLAPRKEPENWHDLEELVRFGNDLQPVVEEMEPKVARVRKELMATGASLAQMSGSGATVFALYEDATKARQAQKTLSQKFGAWVTETVERGDPHWGVDKW